MAQVHGRSAAGPIAETAAEHLVRDVPAFPRRTTAREALAAVAREVYAETDTIYVVEPHGRLQGVTTLPTLLAAAPDEVLAALMQPPPQTAHPEMDQEAVARLALTERLKAVPVTDATGRFLGIVPPLALIDVLRREHVEDMHRLVGIMNGTGNAAGALELPAWRRVWTRLPWLLVGLAGSMVAALVVSGFESQLSAQVAVAFFIPSIVYLADAIGTQTETIVVRGLSASHSPLSRLLVREVAAGAIIGLILGGLAWPAVLFLFGDAGLASAVAMAVFAAGSVATSIGLLFPWLLSRIGVDPAYGSGPVATVVQDVLSLLIYFLSVRLLT